MRCIPQWPKCGEHRLRWRGELHHWRACREQCRSRCDVLHRCYKSCGHGRSPMSSAGRVQAGEVDPEPGRGLLSCGVRRPRVASHGDFHQERCESVHRVLDQFPRSETLLISPTTQEAAAEKLKTQRKRDEGEKRPRHSLCPPSQKWIRCSS